MGTINGHNIRKAELKDLVKVLGWWCVKQANLCHCSKEMLYQKVELFPSGKYTKALRLQQVRCKSTSQDEKQNETAKKKKKTTQQKQTNPNHTLQTE